MLKVYREKLVGPVPEFPAQMEQNINDYLAARSVVAEASLSAIKSANQAPLLVRLPDGGEGFQRLP